MTKKKQPKEVLGRETLERREIARFDGEKEEKEGGREKEEAEAYTTSHLALSRIRNRIGLIPSSLSKLFSVSVGHSLGNERVESNGQKDVEPTGSTMFSL